MDDINKRIHEAAAALAKVKAVQCGECGGHGLICSDQNCSKWPCEQGKRAKECTKPCPTCAKLREIAKQCWHEAEYPHFLAGHFNQPCGIASKEASCKNGCGLKWDNGLKIGGTGGRSLEATFRNPTYTVQTMRTLLEALGEWEGFKWFMVLNCSGTKVQYLNDVITTMSALDIIDKTSSDDHMREVVVAYLEKRIMEG